MISEEFRLFMLLIGVGMFIVLLGPDSMTFKQFLCGYFSVIILSGVVVWQVAYA